MLLWSPQPKSVCSFAGHLQRQLVQGFLEPKHKVPLELTDSTKWFTETGAKIEFFGYYILQKEENY